MCLPRPGSRLRSVLCGRLSRPHSALPPYLLRCGLCYHLRGSGCSLQLRSMEALFNPTPFRPRAHRSPSRLRYVRLPALHGLRPHITQSQACTRRTRLTYRSPPTLPRARVSRLRGLSCSALYRCDADLGIRTQESRADRESHALRSNILSSQRPL